MIDLSNHKKPQKYIEKFNGDEYQGKFVKKSLTL